MYRGSYEFDVNENGYLLNSAYNLEQLRKLRHFLGRRQCRQARLWTKSQHRRSLNHLRPE